MLVVCFITGLINAVRCAKGTTHDFKLFNQSKFNLNKTARIKVDKGFIGIDKLYPNSELPIKESKYYKLTKADKRYNRQLARERSLVEHINRECKIFRICKEQYRGKHKNYEKTWKLISAIVNLKRSTRHLKYASP